MRPIAARLYGGAMVSMDRLLAFAAVAAVIIVVPGPSVLFVLSRALSYGRRVAVLGALGNGIGAFVLVVAVSLGLGPVLSASALLFTTVKLAGAAYLVFLGVRAFRARRSLAAAMQATDAPAPPGRHSVLSGFLVGVTNPKTAIFFAAVLPQFADRSAGSMTPQLIVLGLVFVAIALVSDSMQALAAGTFRAWFGRSERRMELVGGAGGIAMIGLGVSVALTGRKD